MARQVAWGCARTDAAETAGGESICSLLQPDTNQLEQTREGPGAGERDTEGQIRAGQACWDRPAAGRVKTRLPEGGQDRPPRVLLPPAPSSPHLDTQVKGRRGLQPGASLGCCPENTGPSSRPCPLPSSPVPLLAVPWPLFSGGSIQRQGARSWAAGLLGTAWNHQDYLGTLASSPPQPWSPATKGHSGRLAASRGSCCPSDHSAPLLGSPVPPQTI